MKLIAISKNDFDLIVKSISRFSAITIDDTTYLLIPLNVYSANYDSLSRYSINTIPYKLRIIFNETINNT